MTTNVLIAAIAAIGFAWTSPTQAQDAARWIIRAGVHPIQPKPNNHPSVRVGDGAALTASGTYMLSRHWGLDLLAALPVEHDIRFVSGDKAASVRQLPPTLSLQYHFLDSTGRARAYVGVGLNYTTFFNERTTGALTGQSLRLDSSLGPAAQLGLDIDVGKAWFVGIDARWFDIDTRATVGGIPLGTVEIDPYALGLTIGRRLR